MSTEIIDALEGTSLAGANAQVEWYPGTHHRSARLLRPIDDKAAAERHWSRLSALFDRNLRH